MSSAETSLRAMETIGSLPLRPERVTRRSVPSPAGRGSRLLLTYPVLGKRIVDCLIVVALSPLWLPVYVLIAALILVTEGRPIHYRARRRGLNGAEINLLKFRTMRPGADQVLQELFAERPALEAEFKIGWKLRNDPRVTKLGASLRRMCLDEIPQVWNVLSGSMSLVGPRPIVDAEEPLYGTHLLEVLTETNEAPVSILPRGEVGDDFLRQLARDVFNCRPGLTGLWQSSRGPSTTYKERVQLDLRYVSGPSLRADIAIMVRTVGAVRKGDGCF